MLHLPFESANQRLIDKYSSGKWNLNRVDTVKLIAAHEVVHEPPKGGAVGAGALDGGLIQRLGAIEIVRGLHKFG